MKNNWVALDLSSPVDRKYLKDKGWVKFKVNNSEYMIVGFTYDVVYEGDEAREDVRVLLGKRVLLGNEEYYTAEELFNACTFLDGSTIGKKVLSE